MSKNLYFKLIFILLLSTSVLASYSSSPRQKSKGYNGGSENVAASIGKLKITAGEFQKGYDFGPAFYKREKNSKDVYLKFLINEKLLALDGYNRRVDTVKQVKDMFRAFHDDLITGELFNDEIFSKIKYTKAEVDSVITEKQLEVYIKWLYTEDTDSATYYLASMKRGVSFDSLFNKQCTDSSILNDRQLKSDFYNLKLKNPVIAKILDALKAGNVSLPIHVQDGWYLVKLENISKNLISTQSEENNLRSEAVEAVKMRKMEAASDKYVIDLMEKAKPAIRKEEFNILLSYIGNYILPKKKFEGWKMTDKLDSALASLKVKDKSKIPSLTLVDLKNGSVSLADLLNWYWTRDQYIKLKENDFTSYSISLKEMIWRMVRDKLLVDEANKKNLSQRPSVREQERWWKDKIVYSYVKNELANSVLLENKEIAPDEKNLQNQNNADKLSAELSKKILRKINWLKQREKISIDKGVLNSIKVTDENDPRAIELYTVKKGGLIPRTPYPTIDNDWRNWE